MEILKKLIKEWEKVPYAGVPIHLSSVEYKEWLKQLTPSVKKHYHEPYTFRDRPVICK